MTDPSQSDDDWAELARELERDSPPPLPTPEQLAEDADEEAAGADEFDDADVGEGGEGEVSPADGEPGTGDGQPGTGRKRRRRRRRRRKGGTGQPAEATEGAAAETEESPTEPSEEEAEELEEAPVAMEEEGGYDERDADERDDTDEAAEDAGGELLRELIATWNVPSWDEIISGLHRPDR